ncbi:hypothetical protein PENTCL1PPCAC_745, partial [Pristionchus entomophagus]
KDTSAMIIYIKNERGVAYPLICYKHDTVEDIWKEIQVCTALSDRSIVGKKLVSEDGRELNSKDRLGEVVSHFHVVRLLKD